MTEGQPLFADGAAYERFMGRWSALVAETFLGWLAAPEGAQWLDVGCGNGAFTAQVFARCAPSKVHGLDPSPGQLAYARNRGDVGNAQFHEGDALALPFGDATFDVAAMALVISFVPDQARGVAEMRRVVRPGGAVAAYMWDIAGGGLPFEPMLVAMRSLGFATPALGDAGIDHLRVLWQRAGLESVETCVVPIPISFSDADDFWKLNTESGGPSAAAIARLSPPDRERLRARVTETAPRDAAGRITYTAHANAVKARVPR
jgi:SAM-dependent methyltransferase